MRTVPFESTLSIRSQITIEQGLFQKALKDHAHDAVWLYDETLPSVYLDALFAAVDLDHRLALPAREASKTLTVFGQIVDHLDRLNLSRATRMVALGGGAITDAVAFVASTYLRGLPLTLLPTTLLAMVDAAVGGKTALNTAVKNRVGSFYPAEHVYVDTTFLSSLSPSLFAEGMSEIIKVAAVFDAPFFSALEAGSLSHEDMIAKAIELKVACAQADLTDQGARMLLNFGHTLGHALESSNHYQIPHGHCVAAGMVLMTQEEPFGARLKALLERYQAFQPIPFDKNTLFDHIMGDKKRSGSSITIIRLEAIGKGVLIPITLEALYDILPEAYR